MRDEDIFPWFAAISRRKVGGVLAVKKGGLGFLLYICCLDVTFLLGLDHVNCVPRLCHKVGMVLP